MATCTTPSTLHDIEIYLNGNQIGRATSLTFSNKQTGKFHHENGTRDPYAITVGGKEPQGSIVRAYVDLELMKEAYDDNGDNPYLDLISVDKVSGKKWLVESAKFLGFDFASGFEESTMTHEFYAKKIRAIDG